MEHKTEVGVIGAGGWGTAIAALLGAKGFKVNLWARNPAVLESIQAFRENRLYLPKVTLPPAVEATLDMEKAASNKNFIIMAVPSHGMRETAFSLATFLNEDTILVSATKGLEEKSLFRMSAVIEEMLPARFKRRIAVISGPNHAEEVSKNLPAATVAAAHSEKIAAAVSRLFNTDRFRVYTNTDLIGVETGGALKNVIALGAGIADGLGLGDNAKGALLTRGIVEMTRLGVALGAKASTFSGLSGLGDLFVTCSSAHSRNRAVGIKLGQGEKLPDILKGSHTVAEGIKTTSAAYLLALNQGVKMPITEEIHAVLFQNKPVDEALQALMTRQPRSELEEMAF